MVVNNFSRSFIGLILLVIVGLSFYLHLDYLLISLIVIFISYDFLNIKIVKTPFIIISPFILLIALLFLPNQILKNIFLIQILLILIIFLTNRYKKELFFISMYIFTIILFYLTSIDRTFLYLIIFISFLNDTVAYIVGKSIGGPLIIPNISPKKTWSGTSVSFLISSCVLLLYSKDILLAIIISISLFLGDIFFSYIKRILKIKDFSSLLKSHGGILDRLDSMYFIVIILNIHFLLSK